jgi:citrate lyase gamma subunit
MEHDICTHAINVLAPLLMAALTWASTRLAQLINARVRSERTRAVLLRLDDAIAAIIREIQQVTIDDVKAHTPDGNLPFAIRARLKFSALTSVKAYLGPKGIDEAVRALGLDRGAFDAFVSTRIEAAVLDLKNGQHRNGVPEPPALAGPEGAS